MSHKKKKRKHEEVTLNMAAMLDMAFQLLTFFILTYQPADVEGQISLRMPDPAPIMSKGVAKAGNTPDTKEDPLASLNQLVVSLYANKDGSIASIGVQDKAVATDGSEDQKLSQLKHRLSDIFTDPAGSPYDQVVLQIGSGMRYEKVMLVVDLCARQKLHNGQPLSKLTFLELPDGSLPK